MLIMGSLFFLFGFITWLNGALIPFLQIICQLTEFQALLVAFAFYISYVVMALPMAWVLERIGFKHGMVLGLSLIGIGSLLFIPAAQSQMFSIFLLGQFTMGAGLTILQTASNPYLVKIGSIDTAAVRISIMGILNKLAGVVAPAIFTVLVLGQFEQISAKSIAALPEAERLVQIDALANALITPYLMMALGLFLLAVLLKFSKLSELTELNLEKQSDSVAEHDPKQSLSQFPHLVLGVLTLFVYVGVEVIAGDTIGLYGSKLGVPNATSLTSYTMAFMLLGYTVGLLLIPKILNQAKALAGSAILGILLSILLIYSDPTASSISAFLWGWAGIPIVPDTIAFIAILGFANAMVWPTVWPLALNGLGDLTAKASALLIMGIAGGAILPLVYGMFSEQLGAQMAYWVLVPCYVFILFYALKGCHMRQWKRA